jgi:hypothetical protein
MRGSPSGDSVSGEHDSAGDSGSVPTEPVYPSGATELVPPVDPYLPPVDPYEALYPAPAPAPPPRPRTAPAVIFGLVGTLLGVIALAVVITVNCGQLGICQDQHGIDAVTLLPPADPDQYLVTTNPRLPGGLAADIDSLLGQIPAADKPKARAFAGGTRFLVGQMATAVKEPSCGYQPGELAIRLYQDRAAAWSVGLAVVVTGTLGGVFEETSPCFLGRRIAAMMTVSADTGPDPAFCDAQTMSGFTLLTLGSTARACAHLTSRPTVRARTTGDPNTAVRAAAGVAAAPVLRVSPGTAGTVLCHQQDWARITFPAGTPDLLTGASTQDEQTGYVAAADLDIGAGLARQVPPCRAAAADPSADPSLSPSVNPAPSQPAAPSTTPRFDPAAVDLRTCIANRGTAERPDMRIASCADPTSYAVLKKVIGVGVPESPTGEFDKSTANIVCAGTEYDTWYGLNAIDDEEDVFLCLRSNAKPQ